MSYNVFLLFGILGFAVNAYAWTRPRNRNSDIERLLLFANCVAVVGTALILLSRVVN